MAYIYIKKHVFFFVVFMVFHVVPHVLIVFEYLNQKYQSVPHSAVFLQHKSQFLDEICFF